MIKICPLRKEYLSEGSAVDDEVTGSFRGRSKGTRGSATEFSILS